MVSRIASILPTASRPGQSFRLQPSDIVRDRRDARLDPPVPAADMLMRKQFLLRLGILDPLLRVLVERALVGLGSQDAVPLLADDQLRCFAPRVHGVGSHYRAPATREPCLNAYMAGLVQKCV